ncbi:solute carrier family 49 member 4-like [Macrobrachium rosenbergii]|uniref:solute carrier family 49 member 4-like n=1 Tax=Macrobrachium rosenbergii TaxID=79674 RepID=UPI0034D3A7CD
MDVSGTTTASDLGAEEVQVVEIDSKCQPDEATPQSFKSYKRRFWILGIFCFLAFFQNMQWNLWGSLSESVDYAFTGFGSATVAMIANWGTITYLIFSYPCARIMDAKGIRIAVLILVSSVTVGTVLRAGSLLINSDILFEVMCHIAAILNGAVGPLVLQSSAMIAAVWFPPNERTTAAGCGQLFTLLGGAGSYLQPFIVRSPSHATKEEIRSDIGELLYIYVGVSLFILVSVSIYFPAKPPTPPSITSAKERVDLKGSAASLIRNSDFRLTVVAMVLCVAVPSAWHTVLNYSLKDIGIGQDEASGIGFWGLLSSTLFGILVTRITDVLYGHLKASLIFLTAFDIGFFYWFFLLTWGCVEVTQWQVYVSVICGLSLNAATMPLFTQLAIEFAYPSSEVVVVGFLTFGANAAMMIFLFLFLIPNIGYTWEIYLLLTTSCISILLLVFVEENYRRTNDDKEAGVKGE